MGTVSDVAVTLKGGLPTTEDEDDNLFGHGTVAARPVSGDIDGDMYIVVDGTALRWQRWNGSSRIDFQGDPVGAVSGTQGDILYRNATQWIPLSAGTSGQFLKTNGTGANPAWATVSGTGIAAYELFLDAEPTTPNNTYSNTIASGKVTQEKWVRTSDSSNLKTIDYTYTGSKLTTEVRKVFDTDGTTILAQMTLNYTYTSSTLTGETVTRDV